MNGLRKLLPALMLAALCPPARADYIGDQVALCEAPLTPENRQGVIAACSVVVLFGELPGDIQLPAFVHRGNAYALGADFPHALVDYAIAMDIDARNPDPLVARGITLLKQKKFQDAWNDFDAAIALAPRDAVALYGRGLAAQKLGKDGSADLAAATALNPGLARFYDDYGL